MFGSNDAFRMPRTLAWTLVIGLASALVPLETVRAQGMQNMPGMGAPAQATAVSGTGTVAAVNTVDRKVTLDHGPIPAIKWPAMKMEFPTAQSVDLSKLKAGDKVKFTISGSGNSYTVQSISLAP
jgi:Cu(I)/Ag(I) efflux system periplasmic protein CusF